MKTFVINHKYLICAAAFIAECKFDKVFSVKLLGE